LLTLATRQDLSSLAQDLRQEMAELCGDLRAEIRTSARRVVRHMHFALLGQTAMLLGLAYCFATHVR
jgi:hypothetical protein